MKKPLNLKQNFTTHWNNQKFTFYMGAFFCFVLVGHRRGLQVAGRAYPTELTAQKLCAQPWNTVVDPILALSTRNRRHRNAHMFQRALTTVGNPCCNNVVVSNTHTHTHERAASKSSRMWKRGQTWLQSAERPPRIKSKKKFKTPSPKKGGENDKRNQSVTVLLDNQHPLLGVYVFFFWFGFVCLLLPNLTVAFSLPVYKCNATAEIREISGSCDFIQPTASPIFFNVG